MTKGCPQGSIYGPIFWDIVMAKLLGTFEDEEFVRSGVTYADDMAEVVEGDSRVMLEIKTINAIEAINRWCRENEVQVAINKT